MKIKSRFKEIPVVRQFLLMLHRIKFESFGGMSLYELIEMYLIGIVRGALTTRAGGIAFSFIIAIPPMIIFFFSLLAYVPFEGFQESMIMLLEQFLPSATFEILESTINDILSIKRGGLLSFGFFAMLIFSTNGVNSIISGFGYTYHRLEMRNVVPQYLVSMALTIVLSTLLLIALGAVVGSRILLNELNQYDRIAGYVPVLINIGQFLISATCLYLIISLLFYFGPKTTKELRFRSPGAMVTLILFILTSYLFGYYVDNFSKYNDFYGSLGSVMIFMLWIYLNSIVLLIGFELNATIYRAKLEAYYHRKQIT